MKLKLFYNRSVHENAAYYYDLAKESREKIAGLEKAIAETEKEIEEAKKGGKKNVRVKRAKEWYEKFHFAFTGGGRLMIGGRNAQQNDLLVARHMEDGDLFFHADIQGGSAVILKGGANAVQDATQDDLQETAQFAACFSNAWKNGNAAVDVYAVRKDQLSKHVQGGFIPSGAFAITGERKWFRATRLALRIGMAATGVSPNAVPDEKRPQSAHISLVPENSKVLLKASLLLVPSLAGKDKGSIAKSLAKRFSVHPDELLELLPNGKSKTVEK